MPRRAPTITGMSLSFTYWRKGDGSQEWRSVRVVWWAPMTIKVIAVPSQRSTLIAACFKLILFVAGELGRGFWRVICYSHLALCTPISMPAASGCTTSKLRSSLWISRIISQSPTPEPCC
jgi:hypothetical protein